MEVQHHHRQVAEPIGVVTEQIQYLDPSRQQVVVEVAVNTHLHKDQETQVDLAVVELEMEVLLILVELVILHLFHLHKEIMVEQDLIQEAIISLLAAAVVPVVLVVMDLVQTLVVLVVLDHQLRLKLQLLNFMLVAAVEELVMQGTLNQVLEPQDLVDQVEEEMGQEHRKLLLVHL